MDILRMIQSEKARWPRANVITLLDVGAVRLRMTDQQLLAGNRPLLMVGIVPSHRAAAVQFLACSMGRDFDAGLLRETAQARNQIPVEKG